MKAVVLNGVGDSDVMEFVERPEPVATPGHVIVEVRVAGVNFMDIGVRQGMAWTETPNPKVLGVEGAGRLFDWIADGSLKVTAGGSYPLKDAAQAHKDMASRKTTGKLLLIPGGS